MARGRKARQRKAGERRKQKKGNPTRELADVLNTPRAKVGLKFESAQIARALAAHPDYHSLDKADLTNLAKQIIRTRSKSGIPPGEAGEALKRVWFEEGERPDGPIPLTGNADHDVKHHVVSAIIKGPPNERSVHDKANLLRVFDPECRSMPFEELVSQVRTGKREADLKAVYKRRIFED